MRKTRGTAGLFAAVSLICTLVAAVALPGETRRNPALPNPDDLVSFDAAGPSLPVPPADADAYQAAFPLHYGSAPAAPAPRALPREPLQATAPLGPAAPGGGVAAMTPSGEGFVDYQDYLSRQGGDEAPAESARPAAPGVAIALAPPPEAGRDEPPAAPARSLPEPDDMPVPLPPPAEVVAMAAAEATPAARPQFEPPPILGDLVPPPLPELAGGRHASDGVPERRGSPAADPAPTAARAPRPVTMEAVRAEFESLKSYCESDSLGSAAEIYAGMPDFGDDEEINRLRADAANLLILGLARTDNLMAARRVYDSVPVDMPGFDARLAKARAVINLTTYYIRADRFADAFAVLMDVGRIENRSALNNELFRLMARMIPYLDNAEETDKALQIYNLLLGEVKSPGTAALFAENVRASVLNYYLHYVDKSDAPLHRRKRLDFLEHVFNSLEPLVGNEDIKALQRYLGAALMERYAGDPDRAALFYVEG